MQMRLLPSPAQKQGSKAKKAKVAAGGEAHEEARDRGGEEAAGGDTIARG